jgi:hypothetical protein
LQHLVRDLLEPQTDRPRVHRLERENFQNQQIQSALHEIGGLAHGKTLNH